MDKVTGLTCTPREKKSVGRYKKVSQKGTSQESRWQKLT